jgi:hypothetical protein
VTSDALEPLGPHEYVQGSGPECCFVCKMHRLAPIHTLPDSGLRESFGVGLAVREADPNKPALDGISPYAELALGTLMAKAREKYKDAGGFRNWEKGIPVMRCVRAIRSHTIAFQLGDEKEDHLAAIMWNAMVLIHYRDGGTASGVTFAELDDRPKWFKAPK